MISKFEDDAAIQELLESIDDEIRYFQKLKNFYLEFHVKALDREIKQRELIIERIRKNCVEEDD